MTATPRPPIETRQVPREALCFAGDLIQTETPQTVEGGGATLYPFSMMARTPGVAHHPWWGPCVHDFEGMIPGKDRISVDYCHEPEEIVGYADRIELGADGLKLTGALVSIAEGDRAAEIFAKSKAGVPYEASILTNSAGLLAEFVPDGLAVKVNGETFEGPLTVFRKWQLWGVAVLPYGSDPKTQVAFGAGETVGVQVMNGVANVTQPTPSSAPVKTGADYINRFGETRGSLWFAKGIPWDEAVTKFEADQEDQITKMSAELATLKEEYAALKGKYEALQTETDKAKTELSGLKRGTDPLPGTTAPPANDGKPSIPQRFAGLGPSGAFAAAIERRLVAKGIVQDPANN